ncbi:MAG: hypothetical protein ABFD92_07820 [Planctomycetaceae bacterium]|nr:hypothetical protein [Planctomycetaceae bacterium]
MADMLEQAVNWLNEVRGQHLSRQVSYSRGGQSVQVAATLGSTRYDVVDDTGAVMQARATDFIVSAADLILGDAQITPRPGDRISLDGKVFEVLALAGGSHYRWCDPAGAMLRIHSKQVE